MKLTLTKYSKDGSYRDVKIAEFGVNCPYAIKVQIGPYCLTVYRWGCLTLCVSKDNGKNCGGSMEDWASWVLWQDHPFSRFQYFTTKI